MAELEKNASSKVPESIVANKQSTDSAKCFSCERKQRDIDNLVAIKKKLTETNENNQKELDAFYAEKKAKQIAAILKEQGVKVNKAKYLKLDYDKLLKKDFNELQTIKKEMPEFFESDTKTSSGTTSPNTDANNKTVEKAYEENPKDESGYVA